jgi:hypothetical protein
MEKKDFTRIKDSPNKLNTNKRSLKIIRFSLYNNTFNVELLSI